MPPDTKLPAAVADDFALWIKKGAPWPAKTTPGTFVAKKHWSFGPLRESPPPPHATLKHPIDRYLAAAWDAKKLAPVGKADRRTLIRRVTFDLTGLPPTPEEIESFEKDAAPDAYAKLVERLLASPHYGERWGRHWLDVVRYADTAGETADFPVPDAWRYRNYVINAFNADRPYHDFLREQIAGDLLAEQLPVDATPEKRAELVVATGYLAVARRFGFDILKDHHLTLEDTVDVLGKSVLGLTIGCARCHDHKNDPVSQHDYYALFGIFDSTRFPFSGCEHTRVPRDMVPLASATTLKTFQAEMQKFEQAKAESEKALRARASLPATMRVTGDMPNGGAQDFAKGTNAAALQRITVKKGDMLQLAVLPKANHGADSTLVDFEIRELDGKRVWNLTNDALPRFADATNPLADVWHFFDTAAAPTLFTTMMRDAGNVKGVHLLRGAEEWPSVFVNVNAQPVTAFVTVKMPAKSLALHPGPRTGAVVAWTSPIDGVVSVTGRVQDLDVGGGDGIAWTLEHRPGFAPELLATKQHLVAMNEVRQRMQDAKTKAGQAYAVAEGKPHHVPVHLRGDPDSPGEVVPRRFLELFGGQPVTSPEKTSGRLQLAGWLTGQAAPLTARVMANRVWQHHFGAGLVKTPSDFGVRGDPPSHPELLDDLAKRFIDGGWSVKALHRFILSSEAYQRSSQHHDDNAKLDPENVYLWRFSRRRLSAEEIRDSILAVSGDLDRVPGAAHPFPDSKGWGFTQHGPFNAVYDHDKRSVYLMTQRIKRHPFLALFDGPDANASTPTRYTTTVPTQSLFFMNDPFLHAKAKSFADRLQALPTDDARLNRACRLCFGRAPSDAERAIARRFLDDAGRDSPVTDRSRVAWAAWLRVLFASNEFLHVD
jgi:hypothetical protein